MTVQPKTADCGAKGEGLEGFISLWIQASHRHGVSFRLANLGGKLQLAIRLQVFVSKNTL
jgi:hypothetical protein